MGEDREVGIPGLTWINHNVVMPEFKPETEIDIRFKGDIKVDYGNELKVEGTSERTSAE